jgi:hypothetical protein
MKKINYFLAGIVIVLVTIIACEKSAIDADELRTLQEEELSQKPVTLHRVCHGDEKTGYISKPLPPKAITSHLKHGDKYVYSPKEVWTIIKENINNGVIHHWDVNVDFFDGTNFTGQGTYNWNQNPPWDPPNYVLTYLKVWGTVDNMTGAMDIYLRWSFSLGGGGPTFHFAGTSCMCSGIFEVHSFSPTDVHQFSLDQDTSVPCVTY